MDAGCTLARTGIDSGTLAAAGLALLVIGTALVVAAQAQRRGRPLRLVVVAAVLLLAGTVGGARPASAAAPAGCGGPTGGTSVLGTSIATTTTTAASEPTTSTSPPAATTTTEPGPPTTTSTTAPPTTTSTTSTTTTSTTSTTTAPPTTTTTSTTTTTTVTPRVGPDLTPTFRFDGTTFGYRPAGFGVTFTNVGDTSTDPSASLHFELDWSPAANYDLSWDPAATVVLLATTSAPLPVDNPGWTVTIDAATGVAAITSPGGFQLAPGASVTLGFGLAEDRANFGDPADLTAQVVAGTGGDTNPANDATTQLVQGGPPL